MSRQPMSPPSIPPSPHVDADLPMGIPDVPLEVTESFNVDPKNTPPETLSKLHTIYQEVSKEMPDKQMGDVLLRIKEIKKFLLLPGVRDDDVNKVYSWLKIRNNIFDLENQKRSLERE